MVRSVGVRSSGGNVYTREGEGISNARLSHRRTRSQIRLSVGSRGGAGPGVKPDTSADLSAPLSQSAPVTLCAYSTDRRRASQYTPALPAPRPSDRWRASVASIARRRVGDLHRRERRVGIARREGTGASGDRGDERRGDALPSHAGAFSAIDLPVDIIAPDAEFAETCGTANRLVVAHFPAAALACISAQTASNTRLASSFLC